MSERTIEDFQRDKKVAEEEIARIVEQLERDYDCRVTSISSGGFIDVGNGMGARRLIRDSLPSLTVEF